jgi:hypothetical protein
VDFVKDFDIWFGGLFVVIGVIALIVAAVFGVCFIRRPPQQRNTLLFLLLPLGLGLIFTTLGGVFASSGLAAHDLEARLRTSGVTARARVVQIERTTTRLNGQYLWHVRYEYRDPTGRAYEGVSGYLERIEAQSYRVGEPVYIRYDPAEPASSIWLGREERAARPGAATASG